MNTVGIFALGGLVGAVIGATAVLLPMDPYPQGSALSNTSWVNPVPLDGLGGEENYLYLCAEHNEMLGDVYQMQDEFWRERDWTRSELAKLREAVQVLVDRQ